MRRRLFILLLLLVLAPVVLADTEPLRVEATLSRSSMNVTQRAALTVRADTAPGWTLVDLPFADLAAGESLGPLMIAEAPRSAPARVEDGRTRWSWTVELAPDLPAVGEVPALRFKAIEIGGDRLTIERTAPIPVVVESLMDSRAAGWDPTALRPALESLPEPEQSNAALVVSLGVLGVVLIGAALLTWAGRRKEDAVRARRRMLNECREHARALSPTAPVREVAAAAQSIVRRALAAVAGPTALAVTGEQLAPMLRQGAGLSPTDAALVSDLLRRADLAIYQQEPDHTEDPAALRDDAVRAVESVRLAAAGRGA